MALVSLLIHNRWVCVHDTHHCQTLYETVPVLHAILPPNNPVLCSCKAGTLMCCQRSSAHELSTVDFGIFFSQFILNVSLASLIPNMPIALIRMCTLHHICSCDSHFSVSSDIHVKSPVEHVLHSDHEFGLQGGSDVRVSSASPITLICNPNPSLFFYDMTAPLHHNRTLAKQSS